MTRRQSTWTMAERDRRARSADRLTTVGLLVALGGPAVGVALALPSVTLATIVGGVLLVAAAANRRTRP